MPTNCRELTILQNEHGFLIFTRENVDPTNTTPPPHTIDQAIPRTELKTSEYNADPSDLS